MIGPEQTKAARPPNRVPPTQPLATRPSAGPTRSVLEVSDLVDVAAHPLEAAPILAPAPQALPQPDAPSDDRDTTPARRIKPLRRQPILIIAGFVVVLVLAATWFSTSQGVEDIAGEGQIGVRAEATLSAGSAVRNRTAQAVVLGAAAEVGATEPGELEAAAASVERAVGELQTRLADLRPLLDAEKYGRLDRDASLVIGGARSAIDEVIAANPGTAELIVSETIDVGFASLAKLLVEVRTDSFRAISVARDSAGRVALAARFVVAFLIPLGAVLGYRFVARRRQRQRELQLELQKERELVQARDDLIASVSHELRTPLTGILGFALAAVSDEELDVASMREMTTIIATEADDLARMVDDLITAARDGGGGLAIAAEPVDPRSELDSVLVNTEIGGTKVRVEMDDAKIEVDRLRLRQIYRNLLSNAVKHGGPDIGVVGVIDGGRYLISVTDDGDGIPADELDQLFERFVHGADAAFTTGSVGLGLSIAHRLTTLMDGELEYLRDNGRTVFRLVFPLA